MLIFLLTVFILTKIHLFLDDNESKVDVTAEEMENLRRLEWLKSYI